MKNKENAPTLMAKNVEANNNNNSDTNVRNPEDISKDIDNYFSCNTKDFISTSSSEKTGKVATDLATEILNAAMDNEVKIAPSTNLNKLSIKWTKCQVFANDVIPEDEPLLSFGEQVFISKGNLATITGKPKCFKTFLTSSLGAAFLVGTFMNISAHKNGGKLLLVDTEQGKARAQKVQRRINQICGYEIDSNNENLIVLSVRELDAEVRLQVIKEAIADNSPALVLIDGIRDLLSNFNDIEESNLIINEMMKLSSNYCCGIITVIHQNKGDTNARGHLGSELMNKSQSVIEMRKTGDIGTATPLYCRDIEFEPFSFMIDGNGLPRLCDIPAVASSNKEASLKLLIKEAVGEAEAISQKELIANLVTSTNKSEKTAKRRIGEAIVLGFLQELPNNTYQLSDEE